MQTLTILYASTSGHTEFVVDTFIKALQSFAPTISVRTKKVEHASAKDCTEADTLIFASGTWNTDGVEGKLNPLMEKFLFETCSDILLSNKRIAFISLGDDRYYFTTRCTEWFLKFQKKVGAKSFCMPLVIVNEPYDQVSRIEQWAKKLANCFNLTNSEKIPK